MVTLLYCKQERSCKNIAQYPPPQTLKHPFVDTHTNHTGNLWTKDFIKLSWFWDNLDWGNCLLTRLLLSVRLPLSLSARLEDFPLDWAELLPVVQSPLYQQHPALSLCPLCPYTPPSLVQHTPNYYWQPGLYCPSYRKTVSMMCLPGTVETARQPSH